MDFTVVAPACISSIHFSGKVLAEISVLPMSVQVVCRAEESAATRVVVATDDQQAIDVYYKYHVESIMTSKKYMSSTCFFQFSTLLGCFDEEIPMVVTAVCNSSEHALYFSRTSIPYAHDFFSVSTFVLPTNFAIFKRVGVCSFGCHFFDFMKSMSIINIERFKSVEQVFFYHGYLHCSGSC